MMKCFVFLTNNFVLEIMMIAVDFRFGICLCFIWVTEIEVVTFKLCVSKKAQCCFQ